MSGGEANYVHFGYETVFGQQVTANKLFGQNTSIRSVDLKNNLRRLYQLGGRNAVERVAGKFEGALSLEFDLAEPWFLRGVMGTNEVSGTNPYYHSFYESNLPPSLTIENGISGTIRRYLGAIIADCRITCAVGDEPAKAALTVAYSNEVLTSGTTTQQQASTGVYPFAWGNFEYPTSSVIANTESVELTITNNAALKWAIGSRIASRYDMRQRNYDITTTNFFDDPTTYLRRAYGTAVTPTMSANSSMISGEVGCRIRLSNGAVSSATREYIFLFTKATIERHGLPQAVEQENMETVDIIPQNLTVQCFNDIAAMP